MSNLLLLSNSTMPGTGFFSWPKRWVTSFLGEHAGPIVFVPYAAVTISFDTYYAHVSQAFQSMGYSVVSAHNARDAVSIVQEAGTIVVGGGNTFALLDRLYRKDLLAAIRQRVAHEAGYIGWSAGANLACPTLMTTNDMPVAMPPSFEALNLVPFQINPHYHELKFENQGGETRRERLEEFLMLNPDKRVVGLPEGMLLRRTGDTLSLLGSGIAKLYEAGKDPLAVEAGTDVSWLLGVGP